MPERDPVRVLSAVRAGAVAGGVVGAVLTVVTPAFSSMPVAVVVVCTALGALGTYAYEISTRRD